MVPAQKILDTAREQNADIIGLSGLITPSLDEMVHIAREMKRQEFQIPLMIGGATTSKTHTAVKIDPDYDYIVVHVRDASRAVGVSTKLLNIEMKKTLSKEIESEYEILRKRHKGKQSKINWLMLDDARKNRKPIDWPNYNCAIPHKLGINILNDYPLDELEEYFDWTPFFLAWELAGRFPKILNDKVIGKEATRLYKDAKAMLSKIINEKWFTAKGVYGLFLANSIHYDDIEIYEDEKRNGLLTTIHTLRQQIQKPPGQYNFALADFIAPKDSKKNDYIGAFAVAAGFGIEERIKQFENDHDDYSAIMLKALADRFAEAFAERLHERIRTEFWGYTPDESFDNEHLIKESYKGIRPAPGYPSCPDHTEKDLLWKLLRVEENTGIVLTESYAMYPTASVSGWYFSHPDSRYFGLGKINRDQVNDYAQRKNSDLRIIEKWLSPSLGYNPEDY